MKILVNNKVKDVTLEQKKELLKAGYHIVDLDSINIGENMLVRNKYGREFEVDDKISEEYLRKFELNIVKEVAEVDEAQDVNPLVLEKSLATQDDSVIITSNTDKQELSLDTITDEQLYQLCKLFKIKGNYKLMSREKIWQKLYDKGFDPKTAKIVEE